MRTSVYLKSQSTIVNECEARNNDSNNALATAIQYKEAINEVINLWANRVVLPRLYSLSSAFSYGTYEYVLPSYIKPPFIVQIKSNNYNLVGGSPVDNETNFTWHDLTGYTVEPLADGSWYLRLASTPYSESGRIIWWHENSVMPTASITEVGAIDADDTIVLSNFTGVTDPTGILKIDAEFMAFAKSYNDGTGTSYSNLIRGYGNDGSGAASHSHGATIEYAIGVDDPRLWINLYDYVSMYVHALQMHKSTSEDISRHEKLMSFYQRKVDDFWRMTGYVSQRKPRMLLSPASLGPISW